MKRRIRLTESDLHKIVKESVKRVLKEGYWDYGQAGNTGYRAGEGYNGWKTNEETEDLRVFNWLKSRGYIGYDYCEDWVRDGRPKMNLYNNRY